MGESQVAIRIQLKQTDHKDEIIKQIRSEIDSELLVIAHFAVESFENTISITMNWYHIRWNEWFDDIQTITKLLRNIELNIEMYPDTTDFLGYHFIRIGSDSYDDIEERCIGDDFSDFLSINQTIDLGR